MLVRTCRSVRHGGALRRRIIEQFFSTQSSAVAMATYSDEGSDNMASTNPSPGRMRLNDVLDEVFGHTLRVKNDRRNQLSARQSSETQSGRKVQSRIHQAPSFNADKKVVHGSFENLLNRLYEYRLPVVNENGEVVKNEILVETNNAILCDVLPSLDAAIASGVTLTKRIYLLRVMAERNVRELKFLGRVCDTFTNDKTCPNAKDLGVLASSISYLGFYHYGFVGFLKHNLLSEMRKNQKNFHILSRVIMSLSHLKVNDPNLWAEIVAWTRINSSNINRHDLFLVLQACALSNVKSAPLRAEWTQYTNALLSTKMPPPQKLSFIHASATCGELTPQLAAIALNESFMKRILSANDGRTMPPVTLFYNLLRFWNIAAAAQFLIDKEDRKISYRNRLRNFYKFITSNSKADLIWQVKYSRDMSGVETFRRLLHDVAPLSTYATPPYLDEELGILVEANVWVRDANIVTIEQKKDSEAQVPKSSTTRTVKAKRSQSNLQSSMPTKVAILYFTKNHTTHPDGDSIDHLANIRLNGNSQLALNLLRASNTNVFPVVFTQYEMDALADDESRRRLIRHRIAGLSKRFHDV